LSQLQSSTFTVSYSEKEFNWDQNSISFAIETKGYGFSLDENQIAGEIESKIGAVNTFLELKNNDIKRENVNLLNNTKGLIEARKQDIQKNKEKNSIFNPENKYTT